MTEEEVARDLRVAFAQDSIDLDVLIVGSDDRVFRYRHPLPTSKGIQKYVLVHPAASRWGLHANVSRSVHFGAPPNAVRRPYQAAATVEARIFGMLRPGLKFSEILARQKGWYEELGFPGEWELHFQGGPTGYLIVDTNRCLTDTTVEDNQAFEWFVTVTGAKVGELSLLTSNGLELPSAGPSWPCLEVKTDRGIFKVPDIMVR
jgi:antitoxin VapB